MKNGFTLVELLAVIVILSAIVLITRPVILNIMNDAKSEVALRSAESYLTIVEDSLTEYVTNNSGIEDGTYYIMSNGDICLGQLNSAKCSDDIVKIKVSKDAPNEGTIVYENNTVKEIMFVYNGKTIIKNSNGKLVFTEIESPYLGDSLVPVVYNGSNWIVADKENLLVISGVGDVIEPEHGVCAIGSGGNYALAAGRALAENTDLSAREIAEKAMKIAGQICIFTNGNLTIEEVK